MREQLTESDISVTLNQDNFEAELDKLTASGGKIDEKLKKSEREAQDMMKKARTMLEGARASVDYIFAECRRQRTAAGSWQTV